MSDSALSALGGSGAVPAANTSDGKNDTGETIGGIIGAIAGAYFGGPVGASLGYALGSQVGGLVEDAFNGDEQASQGSQPDSQTSSQLAQSIDDVVESNRTQLESQGINVDDFKAAMQQVTNAYAGYDQSISADQHAASYANDMLQTDFGATSQSARSASNTADFVRPDATYRVDDRVQMNEFTT